MSELKVYNATIHPRMKNACDGAVEVYLKSEVDKVIEELKDKLAAAQLVLRLNEPKALYSNLETMGRLRHEIDVVERRECRQKYKRCLAMTDMCIARYMKEDADVNGSGLCWHYVSKEMKYWDRWRERWEALAEKFKEAK